MLEMAENFSELWSERDLERVKSNTRSGLAFTISITEPGSPVMLALMRQNKVV